MANDVVRGGRLYQYNGVDKVVEVPRDISFIDSNSFGGNRFNLEEVILPPNLKLIRSAAFKDCINLKKITFPADLDEIEDGAFLNCTSLSTITIFKVNKLGRAAFKGCTSLKTIELPPNITELSDDLFKNCESIEKIEIPTNVKVIGKECFKGCKNLKKITFNFGLLEIKNEAFSICKSLESIKLPASLEKIGNSVFTGCKSIKTINIPSKIKSLSDKLFYECINLENVELSDGLENIDSEAFYSCENLKKINIPDSVLNIGKSAFYGCTNLTTFIFPNDLVKINECCFSKCEKLVNIKFNEKLKTIDTAAFFQCISLKSIFIPKNVTEISSDAFRQCHSLETIEVSPENEVYKVSRGCLYDKDFRTMLLYNYKDYNNKTPYSYIVIPQGITIFTYFYKLDNIIRSIDSTTNIKAQVLILPSTLKDIDEDLLNDFEDLQVIIFRNGNDKYYFDNEQKILRNKEDYNFGYIPKGVKKAQLNKYLEYKKNISQDIESISNLCFLEDLDVSNNEESYKDNSIYNKNGTELAAVNVTGTTFKLNYKVTRINPCAFENCKDLISIFVDDKNKNYSSIDGCLYDKSRKTLLYVPAGKQYHIINIPNGVEAITYSAFVDCKNIKEISFSKTIKKIASCAFSKLALPKASTFDLSSLENLDTIEDSTFSYTTNITYIHLPNSIKKIEKEAFYNCNDLKVIDIGDSCTEICKSAFCDCVNLTEINGLEHVTKIGKYAFSECTKINKITLSPKLTIIREGCFENCKSLQTIEIPKSIIEIEAFAFNGCNNLTNIRIEEGSVFKFNSFNQLINTKTKEIIFAQTNSKENNPITNTDGIKSIADLALYRNKTLKEITYFPESLEYIGESAFKECSSLKRVTFKNKINLKNAVFSNCKNLETVDLSEANIEIISYKCFSGCTLLNEVKLPSNCKVIGDSAFKDCKNLERITLSSSLTTIDGRAFENCLLLKEVILPPHLKEIGSECFSGCFNLKEIPIPIGIEHIGKSAFDLTTTLIVKKGSYAHKFAAENNYDYKVIE